MSKPRISRARDWTEDAALENGNYRNECSTCGEPFLGHKRRTVCRVCHDDTIEMEADDDGE